LKADRLKTASRINFKQWYTPAYVLLSIASQAVGALLLGLAFIPGIALLGWVWNSIAEAAPFWRLAASGLAAGAAAFLSGDMLLIWIVLTRRIVGLSNRERYEEFRSPAILTMAAYDFLVNLAQAFFLPIVRGTIFINWFYQGMGARIGERTVITTTRIFDCDLIEIGKDCVIGGNVAINGHTGEGKMGIMQRVRIGNQVTIGANTIILPGAVIEDGVVIGANSLVPKDARLEKYSLYGGSPVKKIATTPR